MIKEKYIIEIATSDFNTTRAAVEGGADRIELCANLAEGGTTPSLGMIRQCREAFDVSIYPIIRPRGGDFLYNEEEFSIMTRDIMLCKELGCNGVVIGMLNADGTIDEKRTAMLVNAAYPLGVTFHRAFDRCKDPFIALEQLIKVGCERILTSGQKPTVSEGLELIAELNKISDDRIIIMPGSGLRKENIKMLADKTGCEEFHSSLRTKVEGGMQYRHPAFASSSESYSHYSVIADEVRSFREALR